MQFRWATNLLNLVPERTGKCITKKKLLTRVTNMHIAKGLLFTVEKNSLLLWFKSSWKSKWNILAIFSLGSISNLKITIATTDTKKLLLCSAATATFGPMESAKNTEFVSRRRPFIKSNLKFAFKKEA